MARRRVLSSSERPGGVEVAEEAAGERVARARGVDDRLEREGREGEEAVLGEQRRAVLALLGDDHARPHLHHLARGAHEVRLLGEHAQLRVVQEQDVDHRRSCAPASRGRDSIQ